MANPITIEMLQGMTMKKRMTIFEHARNTDSPEANEVLKLLFSNALLDTAGGGLSGEHIVIRDIEAICRSKEGIAAAIKAARSGEAPLAGGDPLIQTSVREYGYFDTTTWAGGFVAEEMEAAGWLRKGRKDLPSNCVAKSAAFFVEPVPK